ncbi:hypothetical protein [Nocardia sp. NBC_00511]|uniref:hypothetical protein n=1 Tax=Nocardia sp. NBC_00511 TaxID=2903591 RepID=UPI0030DFAF97
MRLPTGILRTLVIATAGLSIAAGSAAVASADIVAPTPPPLGLAPAWQNSFVFGDNAACRIDYRIWAETDPANPGHLKVNLQSLGIGALAAGSAEPDTCNQWMVVRSTSGAVNDPLPQWNEQQVYLRATRTPGDPIPFDVDVTRLPAGTTAGVTITVFTPSAYVPFLAWVERSVLVPYQFTV